MGDHPPIMEMMTEIEVSKVSEVATTEEKRELDMSSYQDPAKPDYNGINHHDQANDHQNSYVYVAEADDLNDKVIVNRNVVAGDSIASLESGTTFKNQFPELDSQDEKLSVGNEEFGESLNEEENRNMEWTDPTKLNCYRISHHNKAIDHKNSYIYVAEADGLNDEIIINKNVVAGDSIVSLELDTTVDNQVPELESQNEKLDVGNEEVSGYLNGEENRNMEWTDPTKPGCDGIDHHNQANDHQNSYICVAGLDGLNDDVVINKNVLVGSLSVSLESNIMVDNQMPQLDALNEKLDAVNGEVSEPLSKEENGNMEWINEFPPLVSCSTMKRFANSLEEPNSKTKSYVNAVKNPCNLFCAKAKPGFHSFSASGGGEITNNASIAPTTEVFGSFKVDNADAPNGMLEKENVEGMGDQFDAATGCCKGKLVQPENEDISVASAEDCGTNVFDREKASFKAVRRPFNLLIKIPRLDDEILREHIRLARLHVDEKAKLRDPIQVQIQEKRANSQIHGINYEYAKVEVRRARELVKSKRIEIDSLLSVINKAKHALSIEDMDSRLNNMDHMIKHTTITLKEEKQLIREIKQLKQLREQLSTNLGSQDIIKQAVEQREEAEKRLKILREELDDIFKDKVSKAQTVVVEVGKKYDDEMKKVKELQAQFKAADNVRQVAYAKWQSLRTELSEKSKHYFKYKDDAALASKYAFSRDTEALHRLCMNQVENFMELWNTSYEFRQEYVRFNARSTIRRFGTLDGRALGPDEKPPILPSCADERVSRMASRPVNVDLASHIPNPVAKEETTNEKVILDGKLIKKVTESKYKKVTSPPAINLEANRFDILSVRDPTDEVYEEHIKSWDEIESLRKEEETRREEVEAKFQEQRWLEAPAKANEEKERQAEKLQIRTDLKTQKEAEQSDEEMERSANDVELIRNAKEMRKEAETKLKEQQRLEELAKANEARERKKWQAEKVQMRAELKAQKEAEQREKKREKRLRKKERKRAAATDSNDINKNCQTCPSESSVENSKDMHAVAPEKPQKPWLLAKQSKANSLPPPLRNRKKKKLQQWMWVGITSFIILVLFLLENIGVFSNVAFKRRGTLY